MKNKMVSLKERSEKIKLGEVKVRKATASDYRDVVKINQNIYAGFDYLPALYFIHLHHPDIYMYVYEWRDQIIGFSALWMLEHRTHACDIASRVMKKYEGQGVNQMVDRVKLAANELDGPFRIISSGWYKERLHTANNMTRRQREILLRWKVARFSTPSVNLKTYTGDKWNVKHFNVEITTTILLRHATLMMIKRQTEIIVSFNQWLPLFVNPSNLAWLAKATDLIQFTFEQKACIAISFCCQFPLDERTNRIDVTYIGKDDASLCASHILSYMSYAKIKSNCERYRSMLHLPISINDIKVEELIKPMLGGRLSDKDFAPTGVFTRSLQQYQAKL